MPSNRTVGLFIPTEAPTRAKVPPTPKIDDLVKNYTGGKGIAQGEEIDPTAENILKRVKNVTLSSGVKAALLPKKTRGEKVLLTLTLRFGNPESLRGQQGPGQFLATLMARGTKKHTRQQIVDELDKLSADLTPSSETGAIEYTVECDRENLPKVVALIGEMLREPTFPADEFEVLKRQSLETLQRSLKEPSALASRAMNRILSPYPKDDVRYTPTFEESIARVEATTVDQVKKLYETQLSGTVGELVVIGDFDPDATVAQVQKALDGWKSPVEFRRIERKAQTDVKGETVVIETPDKKNAFYFSAQLLAMNDTDPDYPGLEVGNYLLGNPNLVSRLGYRVREKEGLSYGVGSQFSADEKDLYARFLMFAICNPENIAKVDRAIKEEVDKILKEGVTEAELADGKKAFLAELKVTRSDDASLAAVLGSELFAGRTFAFTVEFEKKVAALTVADVNRALRRIDPKRLVIVKAGDFQTKEK